MMSKIGKIILSLCWEGNFNNLVVDRASLLKAAVREKIPTWEALLYATKLGVWTID